MEQKMTPRENLWQMLKFTLFSISAGIIQVLTFTLLNEVFHLRYWPAYLTALTLSVLYNFTLNRRFTFRSVANVPVAMLKIALYYCLFTPLSTIGGDWLAEIVGWNEYLVLGLTMLINLATEYTVCRFWVYRGQMNNNKASSS